MPWLPRQEAGTRAACPIPYELAADGLKDNKEAFSIRFEAGNKLFGSRAAGAPFLVYAPGKVRQVNGDFEPGRIWNFAVRAGERHLE